MPQISLKRHLLPVLSARFKRINSMFPMKEERMPEVLPRSETLSLEHGQKSSRPTLISRLCAVAASSIPPKNNPLILLVSFPCIIYPVAFNVTYIHVPDRFPLLLQLLPFSFLLAWNGLAILLSSTYIFHVLCLITCSFSESLFNLNQILLFSSFNPPANFW